MFFFVLCLTLVLGVKCETECVMPECLNAPIFQAEDRDEYHKSGDLLPSNELFESSCGLMVEKLKCARDYENICGDPEVKVNFDALVDNAVEFCDEGSSLRKAYAAHVGCFNHINFTAQDCFALFENVVEGFTIETHKILQEKNIHTHCLLLYILKPCVVDTTEEECGEEAGQAAGDFLNRGMDIFFCSEDDADFFEELLASLGSEIADSVFDTEPEQED